MVMKIQRLNEEMFTPMEQNEMMVVLGGGKCKITEVLIQETNKDGNSDTKIRIMKVKQAD